MNSSKHFQEVTRFEESMSYEQNIENLIMLRGIPLLKLCSNKRTQKIKNITARNQKNQFEVIIQRYEQVHTRGLLELHLSSLHIPHGLWTPHGKELYTKLSYCKTVLWKYLIPIDWML